MLAVASPVSSAFHHTSTSKDTPQNTGLDVLLSEQVEFVEGSSTGSLCQTESKYPYINVPNDESSEPNRPSTSLSKDGPSQNSSFKSQNSGSRPLYDRPLTMTWAMSRPTSIGFLNTGNTCFMNSVLQSLLHTPPLQHLLQQHGTNSDRCHLSGSFCMTCKLRDTMQSALDGKRDRPFIPVLMVNNLQRIAKQMRRGRQEDAHEFLRYSVDALQRSCLAAYPPKLEPKIAETTWVHKLFGGRLRSRVTCGTCGCNSDTFDAILDLSLDIQGVTSLRQAFSKFVQIDMLRGSNKYKCEKCKKLVNADKQFTIHDAPTCLTVHLKRFSPLGRKIGHSIDYEHKLSLRPAMSEGQYGPQYTLYAVISHVGTGPNSGHYYAHVKGSDGSWYQANDEVIIKTTPTAITSRRNAYMLFYIRTPGESLGAAINLPNVVEKKSLKRKVFDDEEDQGTLVSPSLSSLPTSYSSPTALEKHVFRPDITTQLNEKVANQRALAAKKASQATLPLASYASSEADEEEPWQEEVGQPVSLSSQPRASSSPVPPPPTSTPPHTGDSQSGMKRKSSSSGDDDESASDRKRRRPSPLLRKPGGSLSSLGGPFRFTNNLHETRENEANFMPLQHGVRKQVIAQVGSNVKGSGLIRNMKRRYGV